MRYLIGGLLIVTFSFLVFFVALNGETDLSKKCERFSSEKKDSQVSYTDIQYYFEGYQVAGSPLWENTKTYRIDDSALWFKIFWWPPECQIRVEADSGKLLESFYFWD